ncbi:MAG: invasin domain 3-containing protein [bacterium]
MITIHRVKIFLGILIFLCLFIWITCTKKNPVDPTASSEDNLYILTNISTSVDKIFEGDSVTVRVQLLNIDEKPVEDHTVHFNTNIGSIKPAQNITDANGWAETVFYSKDDIGSATIKATSDGAISSSIEVDVLSLEESFLLINAARNNILANGIDTTMIFVTIQGDSVDCGGKIVSLKAEPGTITPSKVTLCSAGEGTARLTSTGSTRDTTSTITAEITTDEGSVTAVPVQVKFKGINLSTYANPSVIIGDGKSTSDISVIIKEAKTDFAIQNQEIEFGASHGQIPRYAFTDDKGLARIQLISSVGSVVSNVSVNYGTLSDSIQVQFRESTPSNLEISAIPSVIIADGESQSEIRVNVTDENNNPAPDGIPVDFEITDGMGRIEQYKVINNGVASSYLTSGTRPDTANIRITVTVSEDSVLQDSISVVYIAGNPDKILVNTNKDTVKADGIDTTLVKAKVMDAQGTPLKNVTISFSASIGDITSNASTNSEGIAKAVFNSGKVGYSTITAEVEGFSARGKTTVVLIPGFANSIILRFNPPTIGVRGTGQNQTTLIQADVRDTKNNPVIDGTNVIFRIVHGPPGGGQSLSSQDSIPTVDGKARVSLSSGTVSGVVRVEAKTKGIKGSIISESSEIMIQAGPPYMKDRDKIFDPDNTHITIRAEELNIWKALGTTELTILVGDKYHNPVPESTAVYLTASGGVVPTKKVYTNEEGIAHSKIYGANPQPTVNNFYHDKLMHNPNSPTKPLPGLVYYPEIGDTLIPNFEGWSINSIYDPPDYIDYNDIQDPLEDLKDGSDIWDLIPNTLEHCDFDTVDRYHNTNLEVYQGLENDGIARIIARTEGRDVNGDSILVWDQTAVIFSGAPGFRENSRYSFADDPSSSFFTPAVLHLKDSRRLIFSLMDENGNPVQSGTKIKASLTSDVSAELSWYEIETDDGWGQVYYPITITSACDTTGGSEVKTGATGIGIEWSNDNLGKVFSSTNHSIIITY